MMKSKETSTFISPIYTLSAMSRLQMGNRFTERERMILQIAPNATGNLDMINVKTEDDHDINESLDHGAHFDHDQSVASASNNSTAVNSYNYPQESINEPRVILDGIEDQNGDSLFPRNVQNNTPTYSSDGGNSAIHQRSEHNESNAFATRPIISNSYNCRSSQACANDQDTDGAFSNYILRELRCIRNPRRKRELKLKIMEEILNAHDSD